MNYLKSTTPLKCDIEIPLSCDPSNCDALPCGMWADIICQFCGLALCSSCESEFPCPDSRDGKHKAEPELDLYLGRVHLQPNFRDAGTYRRAAIQAAKEIDFRSAYLRILAGAL
jgi:hypothetical protein